MIIEFYINPEWKNSIWTWSFQQSDDDLNAIIKLSESEFIGSKSEWPELFHRIFAKNCEFPREFFANIRWSDSDHSDLLRMKFRFRCRSSNSDYKKFFEMFSTLRCSTFRLINIQIQICSNRISTRDTIPRHSQSRVYLLILVIIKMRLSFMLLWIEHVLPLVGEYFNWTLLLAVP